MIKPNRLRRGDKVATISLSWGGAGEIPARYNIGKKQLQDNFDLETKMKPENFRWIIRSFAASKILHNIAGLIVGRPYDNLYAKEYDDILLRDRE